ncbi:hypothetical protein BD779DRAFT_1395385, partial [Infundibulicybe gibba]
FSRTKLLEAVTQFTVCDSQSLVLADKVLFRNCLVATRPAAVNADIPTTHGVRTHLHNAFVHHLTTLKEAIQ